MLNNIVDDLEQNVGSKTLFSAVFIRPEQVVFAVVPSMLSRPLEGPDNA